MQILVSSSQNSPTVCLQEGVCYEGAWINYIDGNSNKRFASYQGIRYAEPPLNNLSFQSVLMRGRPICNILRGVR